MIPTEYEQFEQVVTLGVTNFTPVWGDTKQTLTKIEANVVEAASQGIDIIAFGEEALSGTTGCDACRAEGHACEFHEGLAQTVPGPATDHVVDLAREYDMYVLFGLSERDSQDPKVLYNSVAVIGPEGLLGTYHKIHLGSVPWVTEGIVFKPGSSLPVFPTRFGPIGVQICYDFWFNPELTRILALKGARLVINCCATFKGEGKREYIVNTTRTRAQENLIYTASSNLLGGPGNQDFSAGHLDDARASDYLGHSTIAGPAFPRFQHTYAEAGDSEEIVSATLSFEKLHRWQSVFPWREWRNGRQLEQSKFIAEEFAKLANPSPSFRTPVTLLPHAVVK